MYLLYMGLTHKRTPLSILEQYHFSDQELEEALIALNKEKSVLESIIISTCNRTEFYLVVDQLHTGRYYAKHFLAKWFQRPVEEIEPYLLYKDNKEALQHLFRVAAGLESKIIGETQILGQMKQAFLLAQNMGTTGIILNEVSKRVLTFAKRMHDVYRINARPASISLTAMQMLDKLAIWPQEKKVVILGLGEIGRLLVRYAQMKDFASICLVNRTLSKAKEFLKDSRVKVYPLGELAQVVADADIIFSAVKVEHYILFPSMLKRGSLVFDLCLPRTVHSGENFTLYTIEDLTNQLDQHQSAREEIAQQIGSEVESEIADFEEWRRQLGIVPLIAEIREHALSAQAAAMSSLLRKLPDLTEREQKVINKHMKSIVNQIIKEPILQLKEMSVGENASYDIALISKIFGLKGDKDEGH